MDFNTGYQKNFLGRTTSHWLLKSSAKLYGSGRAAFVDSAKYLKHLGIENLWLPAWQCEELVLSLRAAGHLKIRFYELNDDLVPSVDFLRKLDPARDALLLVDYFASIPGEALKLVVSHYRGPILLDAVHSWLLEDLSSKLSDQVTIFSGFRKLFWKIAGAIVTGGFSAALPTFPTLIPEASPGFPRNLTLIPRYGCLSRTLLSLNNLRLYDELALKWPAGEPREILAGLRSPVGLVRSASQLPDGGGEWHWPDLYQDLPMDLQQHALTLKQKFQVTPRKDYSGHIS